MPCPFNMTAFSLPELRETCLANEHYGGAEVLAAFERAYDDGYMVTRNARTTSRREAYRYHVVDPDGRVLASFEGLNALGELLKVFALRPVPAK